MMTINTNDLSCERCGYMAQFCWSGINVCGQGCFELENLKRGKIPDKDLDGYLKTLISSSIQETNDLLKKPIHPEDGIKINAVLYSRYYPTFNRWVIELNEYHRNNLLWLLNAIGYPNHLKVEPFDCANTGDWVGEIACMLSKPNQEPVLDMLDYPNISLEDLKRKIELWLKNNSALVQR